ncbi:MAG: DUF4301 family protein, partial [Desulfatiglandales bacterium]
NDLNLSKEDLEYLSSFDISPDVVSFQLEILRGGARYLRLLEPVRRENGVKVLSQEEIVRYLKGYEKKVSHLEPIKFVPASGAASRLFEDLIKANNSDEDIDGLFMTRHNTSLDLYLKNTLHFFENLNKFAVYVDLKEIFKQKGGDLDRIIVNGNIKKVLNILLSEEGLNYAHIPKALVKFHCYHEKEVRTPLEEHLVEGAYYVTGKNNICRLHFTISPSKRKTFEEFLNLITPNYEKKLDCKFAIGLSEQDPSTDTLCIDERGEIVRDANGNILLRPGGHGALLNNLQSLSGDLIFIKNVDNVCHDHLKPDVVLWKKVLGGLLLELKEKVHGFIRGIKEGSVRHREVMGFLEEEFCIESSTEGRDLEGEKATLLGLLERPIRVCGVVKNLGEPGGAPFWVLTGDGKRVAQIVEKAQVDMKDPGQRRLFEFSEYFNPVDIVCSIWDEKGYPYPLKEYSDEEAYIVTQKQYRGRTITVLEYPGLWNGRMAFWLTKFVEVPEHTFFPVKKVLDLLRYGHLPKFR